MELLVVALIMVTVGSGVVNIYFAVGDANTRIMDQNGADATVRQVLNTVADHVRGAQIITQASANSLSYTDNSGNTVSYWYSNGALRYSLNGVPSAGQVMVSSLQSLTYTYQYWNGSAWVTGTPADLTTIGGLNISAGVLVGTATRTVSSAVRIREVRYP